MAQIKSENTAFLLLECSKNCLFCLPKLNLLNSYRECCKNLNICVLRNKFWIKSASEDSHNLSVSLVHVKTFTNVALWGVPPHSDKKKNASFRVRSARLMSGLVRNCFFDPFPYNVQIILKYFSSLHIL